jgi:hypothetical protein
MMRLKLLETRTRLMLCPRVEDPGAATFEWRVHDKLPVGQVVAGCSMSQPVMVALSSAKYSLLRSFAIEIRYSSKW